MAALIEIPEVMSRLHKLSVADYHAIAASGLIHQSCELLKGVIIDKIPKSPLHRRTVEKIYDFLRKSLPRFYVSQEQPLTLADSEPEPDLAIILGSGDDFETKHPHSADWVIEVAVSSEATDNAKADIYAQADIPEYWIIYPETGKIEVFQAPNKGRYTETKSYSYNDNLTCPVAADIILCLSQITARNG